MLTYYPMGRGVKPCTCHILTRNDANTIIDCLESVIRPYHNRLFAKILVVIDTRSEDRTGRIIHAYAQRYPNVEIAPYKWSKPPDFAAARNFAISRTKTPYAFWLDGDEVLKEPEQIRAMLSRADGQAFQMWVISPIGSGQSHDMLQPRLFPVVQGVHFQCPVFERIDWSLEAAGVRSEATQARPIFHIGYVNRETLARKNQRNVAIMRKYLATHRRPDPQRQHIWEQYIKLTRAKQRGKNHEII